jgi:hypothetical protein
MHAQVQVVVMSANMGCSHCRQRVADVVSKMNGERLHAEFFHHQDKSFHVCMHVRNDACTFTNSY